MNKNNDALERINIENIIWYIYFFIVGFNLVSNYFETKYIKENDLKARKIFREINTGVFFVAFLIYLYFLYINLIDYNKLDNNTTNKRHFLTTLSLISSILFVIGGAITLYIAIKAPSLDDEIAI